MRTGQQLRDVPVAAEDADDLDGLCVGTVDDEVGAHGLEPERFLGEVLAHMTEPGHPRQPAHRLAELV